MVCKICTHTHPFSSYPILRHILYPFPSPNLLCCVLDIAGKLGIEDKWFEPVVKVVVVYIDNFNKP